MTGVAGGLYVRTVIQSTAVYGAIRGRATRKQSVQGNKKHPKSTFNSTRKQRLQAFAVGVLYVLARQKGEARQDGPLA